MLSKRMTRREKQEQTRARLIEAAKSEIASRGFGTTTIEEISAQAGVTRGAFYSNFTSKIDLFLQLLYRELKEEPQLCEQVDNYLKSRASPALKSASTMCLSFCCSTDSQIVWIEALLLAHRDLSFLHKLESLFGGIKN